MAQKNDAELTAEATVIATETNPGANSQTRIGQMFQDIIDSKASNGGGGGTIISKGAWDASTNTVPSNGDSTILQGFTYDNGNFYSTTLIGPDGNVILPYQSIRALVNSPGPLLSDPTKWKIT